MVHNKQQLLQFFLTLMAIFLFFAPPNVAQAASYQKQYEGISKASRMLRAVDRLLSAGKLQKASDVYLRTSEELKKLASEGIDQKLRLKFMRLAGNLKSLHTKLAEAGGKLPDFVSISSLDGPPKPSMKKPDMGATPGGASLPPPQSRVDGVNFATQVAPMFIAKCGKCHIDQQKGGFSLATYNDLMRGSTKGGRVLVPGGAKGSTIIDLIESGDMPRGGGKVTQQELVFLMRWIEEGAKLVPANAGATPISQLSSTVSSTETKPTTPPVPKLQVTRPTGNTTVSFSQDIAPILTARCARCHGRARTRAQLNFNTYELLLRGGDSGPILTPGKSDASLIIQRIRGEGGVNRMPLNAPALSPKTIQTIETWIREGAHFDGVQATDTLERTTLLVRAEKSTPEELSQLREQMASRNWRLALSDENTASFSSPRFYLLGNVTKGQLEEFATQAENEFDRVLTLLRHPKNSSPIKGRITLLVMANRFDLSEFSTMVQQGDLPANARGTWGYDLVDAYAAISPSRSDEFNNDILMAQYITNNYVAATSSNRAPKWLSEAIGQAVAAKLSPKDSRILRWKNALQQTLATNPNVEPWLKRKPGTATAMAIDFGIATVLLKDTKRLQRALKSMAQGMPADKAIQQHYGKTLQQISQMVR